MRYPLSTSSLEALGDDKLKIDFTERESVRTEPTSCTQFNIDLRIDTGDTLMLMGELLCFRRNYENAVLCFEEALAVRKEVYENDDEKEVMDACHALGLAYEQNQDFDMAMKSYDIVLQSINKTSGNESVCAAQLCCDKSRILRQQGDLARSFLWNARAIAMYRKNMSKCESEIVPQLLEALRRRADMSVEMKNPEQAILSHLERIKMQKSLYGPNHPAVARTLLSLGDLYFGTESFTETKEVFREALSLFSEFGTGVDDPDLKLTRIKIEDVLRLEKAVQKKNQDAMESVSIQEQNSRRRLNDLKCTRTNIDGITNFEEEKIMKANTPNGALEHDLRNGKVSKNTNDNMEIKHSCAFDKKKENKYYKVVATKSGEYDDDDVVYDE